MKKIRTTALLLGICIAAVACKKDYTCKCNVNINIPGFITESSDTTYVIPKTTKKKAKSDCESTGSALNSQAMLLGGSASCSIQ